MAKKVNPTEHRMTRRSKDNDYSLPGMYHVTLRVADGMGHPFGKVAGDARLPDANEGAPHVELSAVGRMVEHELLNSIRRYYPMVEVQDYVVMPEHMHFIIEVHEPLVSKQGRKAHLGQVIAGFKKGCNRRFWEITGQTAPEDNDTRRGEPAGTNAGAAEAGTAEAGAGKTGDTRQGKPASTNAGAAEAGTAEAGAAEASAGKTGDTRRGEPAGTNAGAAEAGTAEASAAMGTRPCPAVYPQGYKVPSRGSTGRQVLFAEGYVDMMPLRSGQLKQQRAYIRNNPRSRLLRSTHRDLLQPQRGGIDTALTVRALMKYLQSECLPRQLTPATKSLIESRLLTTDNGTRQGKPASTNTGGTEAGKAKAGAGDTGDTRQGKPAGTNTCGTEAGTAEAGAGKTGDTRRGKPAGTNAGGRETGKANTGGTEAGTAEAGAAKAGAASGLIACDSYGSRELLTRRLLPVVCHRRDAARFGQQKERCLTAAQEGAILVSARIATGEQEIIDTALSEGASVVLVIDNGMPELYHPSANRIELCLAGRMLLVTPWQYHYQTAEENISVAMCKTMNCVVQALCRLKDDWWKETDKER